jgi:ADP-ribosyl-[dinitrogen reductase] hydrolase
MSTSLSQEDRFAGLLLGTAVGDALGLPAEGMSPARIRRRWAGDWRMRLLPGRGMVSDDTEHTFFVAQALLAAPRDPVAFQRRLAAQLRWWLLALPAGVGWATARACVRLWLGFAPERSGVWSAGNGPAMRSALLGAFFAEDPQRRREFVAAGTRLTHTDPRAETAALAVAEAAACIMNREDLAADHLAKLRACGSMEEWQRLCDRIEAAGRTGESVRDFARSLGLERGVTGYAFHTVPVALHAWLTQRGDFRGALTAALDCGGDTDTLGAIVGALAGCACGEAGIPAGWLDGVCDWPRGTRHLRSAAARLAAAKLAGQPQPAVRWCWPGVLPRNLFFLLVVLGHGIRRLLPPYGETSPRV